MAPRTSLVLVAFGIFLLAANAQSTPDTFTCISGVVKTLTACNSLSSQINYCAGPSVATGAPFVSCFCNQQVFNGYYDCDSEERLCLGNDRIDTDFTSALSEWHSACDGEISTSLTTPVISSLTSTYDEDFCQTAASACQGGVNSLSQCSISYASQRSAFSSCVCQPQIASLEYTCLYLGNVSCKNVPGSLAALPVYTLCDDATSLLAPFNTTNSPSTAAPASVSNSLASATLPSSLAGSTSSTFSVTRPALPSSSPTSPSTPSTVSSSVTHSVSNDSYAKKVDLRLNIVGLALASIIFWCNVLIA